MSTPKKQKRQRAAKQVDKQVTSVPKAIEKQLFHLQAKRFCRALDATAAAQALANQWKFHNLYRSVKLLSIMNMKLKDGPKKGKNPTKLNIKLSAVTRIQNN